MEHGVTGFAVACAILCAIVSMVLRYMGRRRLYKLASKFDGPPTLPLIGNADLFIGNTEDHFKTVNQLASSYLAPFRFWIAHRLIICATDPEQIKTILVSPKTVEKGYFYDFLTPTIGHSLVNAPASRWRVLRKLIQPTFNAQILNSYVSVFDAQSKILADKMEPNVGGTEFEVFDLLVTAALDMLCETMMDTKIGAQTNPEFPYVDALQKLGTITSSRLFTLWQYPDFIFHRTQSGKEHLRVIKIIHDFTDNVLRQKRAELLESDDCRNPPDNEDDEYEPRDKRKVFMDHLLEIFGHDKQFSNEELRNEITEMIIAGHESVSIALSYVILMLASHPEIQEKAYQELFEIYGDDDVREVTHEDLTRMNYLERVIKETLRLFPVFPFLVRAVTDDLDIGGHILPEGSEAAVLVYEVQRNEKYWPNPMKFDPDRFLPEEVAKRHPYSFLAFSAGPRNCIGLSHAKMAMKTVLATILRRYTLKKDDIVPIKDISLKFEVVLKPVHPITVKIEKRARIQH